MKIPSLRLLLNDAKITFLRFTLSIISSLTGAIIMVYIIGMHANIFEDYQYLYNIVMACTLGVSFFISLIFICDKLQISRKIFYLIQAAGLIIILLYYFTLSSESNFTDIASFLSFLVTLHLLVSLSPYFDKNYSSGINGFWQFNQILFIRILVTAVFSGALYVGLSIAILSFDKLFNTKIDSKIYAQLFFVILGFFNTWFFLSGLPEKAGELENQNTYPKVLKIFTQYVLIPLVIIYLLILYLYTGKIIIQWQLPMGWVSYLVLGFSATGIFSLLLIHPLRNLEGIKWIKNFSRAFYLVLFPLIVLLFIAILRRTEEYGITERRYYVFILACWLTGITLYFTLSKIKNIKIIPLSLCLLAFFTSFGPWGAFSISQNSQMSRLQYLLEKNEILVNGKIQKAKNPVSDEEVRNINSIVIFLDDRQQIKKLQPWFNENLDTLNKTGEYRNYGRYKSKQVLDIMGIKYSPYNNYESNSFYYMPNEEKSVSLKGYDYLIRYTNYIKDSALTINKYQVDSTNFEIAYYNDSLIMPIKLNGKELERINVKKIIEKLNNLKTNTKSSEDMTFGFDNESSRIILFFHTLNGERNNGVIKLTHINAEIYIGLK